MSPSTGIISLYARIAGSIFLLLLGCDSYDYGEFDKHLPETVDFNFHVKPILSDHCFTCHGPDKNALEAELRLDTEEGAFKKILESGAHAFVQGSIRKSEAFQRITSPDPDHQMPPPEFPLKLSGLEIATIGKWIDQGAPYQRHWAFTLPQLPNVPVVEQKEWVHNAIDHFVLKKLENSGLMPNTMADRETLLRRVSLDLTGLPPSIEEIDNFLADSTLDAYEKVVDRLMASPHFGERMALDWLDVARYADSHGYSQDGLRIMWPWRDWVINAFNENMPFDRFIQWQIAGDKLPRSTQDQRLATGFLRNNRLNGEGGIVDEEYRVEYVADRTETMATAFLGMTLQCARCHDHKYDPISQEEYYQLFSFFNQMNETGISTNDGNSGPQVLLSNQEADQQIAFLQNKIDAYLAKADSMVDNISANLYRNPRINLKKNLVADLTFEEINKNSIVNHALPGEVGRTSEELTLEEGIEGNAVKFTGYETVTLANEKLEFDRHDQFSMSFYIKPHHENPYMTVLNHLGSSTVGFPGYEVAIIDGFPTLRLVRALPANLIAVRTAQPIIKGAWMHLVFTYDGSGTAKGIRIFINGEQAKPVILFDHLTQSMRNRKKRLRIGGNQDYQVDAGGFGLMDNLKIYNRRLSKLEAKALYKPLTDMRKEVHESDLKEHYLYAAHKSYQHISDSIRDLRKKIFGIQDTLMGVMAMEDLPVSRSTYLLGRGAYDSPQQQVWPGTPQAIFPLPDEFPKDRLGLANWLTDTRNPLTSRVIVNRFWQLIFGTGLVKTAEDFGNQGALPTHPALLDWLAVTFKESGWDTQALLKQMVMSSVYRQSSRVSEAQRQEDPENALLARGPSRRLQAELIRDCVLAASGLLITRIGGPSVKPYQPEGLWAEKGEFSKLKNYIQDTGDNLYRRGMYTFWRRTSPLPSMTIFDAPNRDLCTARRQETNTPLQALVMLNDPQFVEAARVLAERVMLEVPERKAQIIRAYRLLTGLTPDAEAIRILEELEERERTAFEQDLSSARELISVGEFPLNDTLSSSELAAMTLVCSTIMSFDETLVKR